MGAFERIPLVGLDREGSLRFENDSSRRGE
jgi:hypothetical protein